MCRKTNLLIVFLMVCSAPSLIAQEMWGIRNLEINYDDTVYQELNPYYYATGVDWQRAQPNPTDPYDWGILDSQVDSFVNKFGGELVLLVSIQGAWAVEPIAGDQTHPPTDLDRSLALSATVPDSGYSATLYTFVKAMMGHLDSIYSGTVRLRFINEPQFNWAKNAPLAEADSVIEDYIRCLRTFYRAAHDTIGISDSLDVQVSHGGIYIDAWQKYSWYLDGGNGGPSAQDSIVDLFQSRYNERAVLHFNDWNDVASTIRLNGEKFRRKWVLHLAGQTDWIDYWDVHYHFKPRFLETEYDTWEQLVTDSAGTVVPWFSAETAMQLANQDSGTVFEERFHAGDMVRKWVLAFDLPLEGFCTPLVGIRSTKFFGLFNAGDTAYQAYAAWKVLQSELTDNTNFQKLSANPVNHFRHGNDFDILWADWPFDSILLKHRVSVAIPTLADSAVVFDIFGVPQDTILPPNLIWVQVGQEPVYIKYYRPTAYVQGQGINPKMAVVPSTPQIPNWTLFPNPARDEVVLEFPDGSETTPRTIQVIDGLGRLVYAGQSNQTRVVLNIRDWNPGLYVTRATSGDGMVSVRKLVIQR